MPLTPTAPLVPARNTWRKVGSTALEVAPIMESSSGTSRHPITARLSLSAILAMAGRSGGRLLRVPREEADAGRVRTRRGEREVDDRPVEGVGYLDQDAGAVTRLGLAAL